MKRKLVFLLLAALLLTPRAGAREDYIRWVDFRLSCEAMEAALAEDIRAQAEEQPLSWIDILALASVRAGGARVTADMAHAAAKALRGTHSPEELLGEQYRYFSYFKEAYTAALGGLVGNYAIARKNEETGETVWSAKYGVKAFSPIAAGYWYSHYDDFGSARSFGFRRRHLGNDLLGSLGTPIVAVEGGTVEALGWNQYGGWRVGIRSQDRKRYYYYAHLRKDNPYAPGLREGDTVEAGQVIGFMGRTGYSVRENVNNIEIVHLHFGLQLIFDESQKECDSEIWIDVYPIVRFLEKHRSSVRYDEAAGRWERIYPFLDLDR